MKVALRIAGAFGTAAIMFFAVVGVVDLHDAGSHLAATLSPTTTTHHTTRPTTRPRPHPTTTRPRSHPTTTTTSTTTPPSTTTTTPLAVTITDQLEADWVVGNVSVQDIVTANGTSVSGQIQWVPNPGCIVTSPATQTIYSEPVISTTGDWACPPGTPAPGASARLLSPSDGIIDGLTSTVEGLASQNGWDTLAATPPPQLATATVRQGLTPAPNVILHWSIVGPICQLFGPTQTTTDAAGQASVVWACSQNVPITPTATVGAG